MLNGKPLGLDQLLGVSRLQVPEVWGGGGFGKKVKQVVCWFAFFLINSGLGVWQCFIQFACVEFFLSGSDRSTTNDFGKLWIQNHRTVRLSFFPWGFFSGAQGTTSTCEKATYHELQTFANAELFWAKNWDPIRIKNLLKELFRDLPTIFCWSPFVANRGALVASFSTLRLWAGSPGEHRSSAERTGWEDPLSESRWGVLEIEAEKRQRPSLEAIDF